MSVISITLAYILGIKWGLYQDFKILVGLSIFLLIFTLIYKKEKIEIVTFLMIISLIGCIYSKCKFNYMSDVYKEEEYKMDVTVISHESVSSSGYSYKYLVKNENNHKLNIYVKYKDENLFEIGYKLKIIGEFDKPDTARNTGGFDYQKHLYSNNIYGTINCSYVEVIDMDANNLVYNLQNKIRNNMLKILDKETAGILIGMLIGETNDISKSTQENFKQSGITHLLAVSGANVMMIISISNFLFSKFVGRKYDYFFSISFIIFFTLIASSSASVVRASIMAITNIILNLLLKKNNPIYNLSFSVLSITIFNPLAIENVGLILSVFGTLGIILLYKELNAILGNSIQNKLLKETASVTLSAQIFLLPIMAYYFNNVSLISLFSNLIIVPVAESLSVISLCSFAVSLLSINLAKVLAFLPKVIVKYVLFMSKTCANLNFLNFTVMTPKLWMIVIFHFVLFLEHKRWRLKQSLISLDYEIKKLEFIRNKSYKTILILIITMLLINMFPQNYVQLTAIDVGQGDSFLITTSHKKEILIDGGGSENGSYDVGENVLLPYMLDKNIHVVDYVFVSHAHADHIEGIYTLIENLKVKNILITTYNENNEYMARLKSLCAKYNVPITNIKKGDAITIDEVKFELLYPDKNTADENENNLSMLLKVTAKDTTLLFTGDLEKAAEENLKNINLKADILKVSHHGSKTSTTQEFLDKVNPDISIISVGENNSFGHPNQDVINRLKETSNVFMTKDLGEINIRIYNNNKLKIDSKINK